MAGEIKEMGTMRVPARYILAAIAFGFAALGFVLLPVEAKADCMGNCAHAPPSCDHGCSPPPPPPPPSNCCRPPVVVVPPPHVPPPNIVIMNPGARASAQSSAIAIAIANVQAGDTIIRQSTIVEGGGGAAAATSAMLAVTEASVSIETAMRERDLVVQAICLDAAGNPHPASQTFAGRGVAADFSGEIFRCMAGTRMRATMDGRSFDCAPGEALWYENGQIACRQQIARRPCNERSLLRRFGPGEKLVRIRDTHTREARSETNFSAAMTMDGGVGQGIW
jgi:hypothetical protein